MAIEMALLGLLRSEPRHGYDLAREFAPDTVLGDIVRLDTSLLYANLKKLEREGLVVSSTEQPGPRPPRRILTLTPLGEQRLDEWLTEPVARTRDVRLEFLLKLYIARLVAPQVVQRLIVDQHAACTGFIASLSEQLMQESDVFRRLVLEMRLAQNHALLGWLEHAQEESIA